MATIREQILAGQSVGVSSDAPPGSSWFVRFIWAMVDLDEPALVQLDEDGAQIIWHDGSGHTISWHLGQLELEGNTEATEFCNLLAQFLGPNHCENAFEHGN